jgi:hypothetical protein
MKLRMQANSVRLRLSNTEVAQIAHGEVIAERVCFPGGALDYRLAIGGGAIAARFSPSDGISIEVPQAQAQELADGGTVSLRETIDVAGNTLQVLIERDLKP